MDLTRIVLGLILSIAIGGLAYWRNSLTVSGWIGAVVVGTLTFGFGGWPLGLALITFFVSSSGLSHYKEAIKERRAAEKFSKGGRRDFAQTMANGGLGALLALIYGLTKEPLFLAAFVGVMGTVNADTWATELGVLSPHRPRLITTGKEVEPGTSGGISIVGTSASAAGGLLIGVAMVIFYALGQLINGTPLSIQWWLLPASLLGGLLGSLSDSLMGATVQAIYRYPDGRETERTVARDGKPNAFVRGWRWMNNDFVNAISSICGALVSVGVFALMR